jgi:hypothetical protein
MDASPHAGFFLHIRQLHKALSE